MESDNSSMDGEVNPHWRESLDTKQNHVLEEDQYPAGKGPKSPPENNEHEATSAVSSDSSTQGSPRSQSPSGYNDKQPHTPPNDVAEHNGDHDGDDRLSLSPEPQDRHSLENRERNSRSRSPDNQNEDKPSSPALSEAKSPRATDNASPPPRRRTLDSPDKVPVSKSLAEDLSDVSDIESDGNDNDILNADDDRDSGDEKRKRNQINGGVTMTLAVTEEEQLD
ncbi:structural maintenance of chromosomes protein 6, partial [Diaphorina citri]|uniref:Structural maintenance of chromosomes protein 6 n=1 Tax=Diaphorina citri TaxID=121845 RepID=A0A1S3DID9_DIACI